MGSFADRPGRRLADLPQPLVAALWMVGACFFFAALNVVIRHAAQIVHPFEVAFFRNFFGLAFMLPWLVRAGFSGLRTGKLKLYGWRAALGLVSMLCWFQSLGMIPVGKAVALSFAAPLFSTFLAATLLKEKVGIRRWSATLIGFAGVLIIVRPGFTSFGLGEGLALASAALMAIGTIIVKTLSRTEPTNAVVTYMVLLMTPMSLLPAVPVWDWPAWSLWPWLVAMGAVGSAGHFCFTRSLAMADASAVIPYDYTRLLFVAGIAWIAFGEFPDGLTWVGAAVIAVATIYITRREAFLARQTVRESRATQAAAMASDPAHTSPPAEPGAADGQAGRREPGSG
ncbi:MAG: DMT family transporter [Dongiaceae bacterium]